MLGGAHSQKTWEKGREKDRREFKRASEEPARKERGSGPLGLRHHEGILFIGNLWPQNILEGKSRLTKETLVRMNKKRGSRWRWQRLWEYQRK